MRRGLVFAGGGAVVLVAVTSLVSAQPGPAAGDPFELFKEMVPVLTHDRCTGCHGRVNPSMPINHNHGGDHVAEGEDCTSCHDAPATQWRVAPAHFAFVNMDARELCRMQSREANVAGHMQLSREAYFRHLQADHLIQLAFDGMRGGATESRNPPGMSKPAFLAAAKAWLDAGAGCATWNGTITQTETFASNYGFPMQGGGTISMRESANRVVNLARSDGSTTAEITMSGHRTEQLVKRDGSCTTTVTNESDWSNAGSTGQKPATIRFEIAPDGSYRIRFRGSPEKTRTDDSGTHVSSCGSLPQPTPGQTDLDWDPWVFNIRCPPKPATNPHLGESIDCDLFDPENWPRLKGKLTRVIVDRSYADDPQSWLMTSPASVGRADTGEQLPVTVVTEWDFTLVN